MDKQTPQETNSWAMIRTLVLVAAISGLMVALSYLVTIPYITKNKEEALKKAVMEVIPGANNIKILARSLDDLIVPFKKGQKYLSKYYLGFNSSSKLLGIALEASGQGFVDKISLIYGYNPQKELITGIKILESKETPGVGDKIDKDPLFLKNFEALDVKLSSPKLNIINDIEVVKRGSKQHPWQIDAITGATISSKAIGKILQESNKSNLPPLVKYIRSNKKIKGIENIKNLKKKEGN